MSLCYADSSWAVSADGWAQFVLSNISLLRHTCRRYKFSKVQPNAAHEGIARLQRTGWARALVTQNVDRLHHKAGSPQVLELHGTTHE